MLFGEQSLEKRMVLPVKRTVRKSFSSSEDLRLPFSSPMSSSSSWQYNLGSSRSASSQNISSISSGPGLNNKNMSRYGRSCDSSTSSSPSSTRMRDSSKSRETSNSREYLHDVSNLATNDKSRASLRGGQSLANDASKVLQQSPSINILKIKLESANSKSQGREGLAPGGINNNNSMAKKSPEEESKALPVRVRGFKTDKAQWPTLVQIPDRRPDMPPLSSRLQTPIVSSSSNPDKNANKPTNNKEKTEPPPWKRKYIPKAKTSPQQIIAKLNSTNKSETEKEKQIEKSAEKTPEPTPSITQKIIETFTRKTSKEQWISVREKHCPVTSKIVQEGNGENLKNYILKQDDKKFSFNNIKLTKVKNVKVGGEEVVLKKVIAGTKSFEDRATNILQEMRKQRRSMQLEYCNTVSVPKSKSGWRDKISRQDSFKKRNSITDESAEQIYIKENLDKKRNSITKFTGTILRRLSFNKKGDEKSEKNEPKLTEESNEKESTPIQSPKKFQVPETPLDFILRKEEYLKENPPEPKKKTKGNYKFCRDRSVESDNGEDSMESVINSLKKIVKVINPKREFPSDIRKREIEEKKKIDAELKKKQVEEDRWRKKEFEPVTKVRPTTWSYGYGSSWEQRMNKYAGASITPYNSCAKFSSCLDLREDEEDRRMKAENRRVRRERLQNKVLANINQAYEPRLDDPFETRDIKDFSIKGWQKIIPEEYSKPGLVPNYTMPMVLEAIGYRRRVMGDIISHFNMDQNHGSKKIRPSVHEALPRGCKNNEAVIVTDNTPWETVLPLNILSKSNPSHEKTSCIRPRFKATVNVECRYLPVVTCPGTVGMSKYCEQHKWNNLKCCAVFSIVGEEKVQRPVAKENKKLIVSLPKQECLDNANRDVQIFEKCLRKPQSELIKDILAMISCTLGRISFYQPPQFVYFDSVLHITKYLRTKKNINRYKVKQEEKICKIVDGKMERRASNDQDVGYITYGTV